MNNLQINLLSMFYEVKSTCNRYQPVWTADTVFTASFNQFVAKLPLIEQNRDNQLTPTKWATEAKDLKQKIVEEKILFLIKRIQSFANANNNNELYSSVDFTPTALKRVHGTQLIGICNVVMAKATEHTSALVSYGITPDVITSLNEAITAFSDALTTPGSVKSGTKTATENLATLFKEAEDILVKRLDLDIEMYKTANPDFYSQYHSARMVITKNKRSFMLIVHVDDAASGEPLKNVNLNFTLQTDASVTFSRKSAEKGNLRVANIPEGIYEVTAEKIGYITQQLTVPVLSGEPGNLEIKLNKA